MQIPLIKHTKAMFLVVQSKETIFHLVASKVGILGFNSSQSPNGLSPFAAPIDGAR